MSEHAPQSPENFEALASASAERLDKPAAEHSKSQQHHEADKAKQAEQARAELAQTAEQANPLERLAAAEKAESEAAAQPAQVNRELKGITLKRELKNIQHKLPASQRALSKVVHQPVVRAVSETASKSVTRPSGLLGGGLVAFLGSCSYLYLAKHVGFTYNYFVFLLLFAVGFIVGLVLEVLVWTFTSRRRQTDL